MATLLDAASLANFSQIFVFLFVVIAVFALMSYMKILGDNKLVHILIAMIIGFFILMSPIATLVVENVAPLFAVLFVFIILISVAGKMVSADIGDFAPLKNVFIVIAILVIVVVSGSTIRSNVEVPGDNETNVDFDRDYSQTSTIIFHPKFLGMILIFAVAIFTVALLVSSKI